MAIIHDLSCQEFVELVTGYLEGTLAPDRCAALEAHLEVCSGCRLHLGKTRLTTRALHAPAAIPFPADMRNVLLQHFRDRHA